MRRTHRRTHSAVVRHAVAVCDPRAVQHRPRRDGATISDGAHKFLNVCHDVRLQKEHATSCAGRAGVAVRGEGRCGRTREVRSVAEHQGAAASRDSRRSSAFALRCAVRKRESRGCSRVPRRLKNDERKQTYVKQADRDAKINHPARRPEFGGAVDHSGLCAFRHFVFSLLRRTIQRVDVMCPLLTTLSTTIDDPPN